MTTSFGLEDELLTLSRFEFPTESFFLPASTQSARLRSSKSTFFRQQKSVVFRAALIELPKTELSHFSSLSAEAQSPNETPSQPGYQFGGLSATENQLNR